MFISVAHLDNEERSLVLGVVFEELLSWVRELDDASSFEALVYSTRGTVSYRPTRQSPKPSARWSRADVTPSKPSCPAVCSSC